MIMYVLMTKFVRLRYIRYYLPSSFFFSICMDRDEFKVNKIAKHTSSGP